MGLLPRVFKLAVGALVLLALISLPTSRVDRNLGSALTPSIAWAGGSPDETLKPPVEPPPPATPPRVATFRYGGTSYSTVERSKTRLDTIGRWEIFYRVFRMFATRY